MQGFAGRRKVPAGQGAVLMNRAPRQLTPGIDRADIPIVLIVGPIVEFVRAAAEVKVR